MSERQADLVLCHIRSLLAQRASSQPSDCQLLERFLAQRDERAFTILVERHGPMVLAVCRSVLHHAEDAQDAYQATFLVLARKAASIRRRAALGSWLHGVAYRLASKARVTVARRRAHEGKAAVLLESGSMDDLSGRELRGVLYEELNQLPDRLRAPLVLCYLEAQTQEEAARQLGWTVATLKGRLQRGRDRLRFRLTRRGLALSVPLLAAVLSEHAASATFAPALVLATSRAALDFSTSQGIAGPFSSPAVMLAQGHLRALALSQLFVAMGVLLAASVLVVVGASVSSSSKAKSNSGQPGGPAQVGKNAVAPEKAKANGVGADRFGDPLPPGALVRMGTVRLHHRQDVNGVAFSPDGKILASAGWDEAIRLWEARTGKMVRELTNPRREGSFAVAFSPDGTKLASVGESGSVRLWDVGTGKILFEKKGHQDRTYGIAFATDGRAFASAGGDGMVRVWDLATARELTSFRNGGRGGGDSHSVAFSPDGKTLASGFGPTVRLWDLRSGTAALVMPTAHGQDVVSLAFSADGKTLISGGYHYVDIKEHGSPAVRHVGGVRLWEPATGKLIRELEVGPHDEGGCCIAVSGDGKILAGAFRNKIRLWDLGTGEPIRELADYWNTSAMRTHGLALSPDGKRLAAASGDDVVRLWDVTSGKQLGCPESHTDSIRAIAHGTDGNLVATASRDNTVRLWDAVAGKELRRLPFGADPPAGADALAFSPDGQAVAAGGQDYVKGNFSGLLKLWDIATAREVRAQRLDGYVSALAFGPDGKTLALATWESDKRNPFVTMNNVIRIRETATGKEQARLTGHKGKIRTLAFAPNGQTLASVGEDQTARIWDMKTRRQCSQLQVNARRGIDAAAFSADGETVVTSELFSDALILWGLATGRERRRIQVEGSKGSIVAFSPDGKILASGSMGLTNVDADYDYALHLWEVATGREIVRFQPGSTTVASLAFSPDGKRLTSGMDNGTALTWDVTGRAQAGGRPELMPGELDARWSDLASLDVPRAYRAVWTLVATPVQAVPFLKDKIRPVEPVDPQRLARLIANLDSTQFALREKAKKELAGLGPLARPALHKALAQRPTIEASRRLEQLLEKLEGPITVPDELRALRAIQVLEHINSPDAKHVLGALAKGAPEARLTQEAKASLQRLTGRAALQRLGEPDHALPGI